MELRHYWHIIWKRWWIVAVLVLLTGGISAFTMPARHPMYQARLRVTVGLRPEERGPATYTYDRYYTWLTSEYLIDSFSEVVKSQAFADDVSARLAGADPPIQVPAGAIQGATVSEQLHRILTITITWPDPEQLRAIADAAVRALQEENAKYFAQLGTQNADIYVIDAPVIAPVGPGLRERLDLPIRLFLALVAGIALTFLLDYLDLSVRDKEDVEAMGLVVLGQIPARRRFLRRRREP
ncbi:MAG: YveK family protein [Anaerolineae bacterium]